MTPARRMAIDSFTDAEQYLAQAIGLPDSIDGRRKPATHLRIAVVFSWIAVDEEIRAQIEDLRSKLPDVAVPEKFYDRLLFCLAARQVFATEDIRLKAGTDGDFRQSDLDQRWLAQEHAFHAGQLQVLLQEKRKAYPEFEFQRHRQLRERLMQGKGLADATACVVFCRALISELVGIQILANWALPAMTWACH